MKFKNWIESKGGPTEVGKLLGMTPHAVRTWLRCESSPVASTMQEIVKLSRGKVDFADIIKETKCQKKKPKK